MRKDPVINQPGWLILPSCVGIIHNQDDSWKGNIFRGLFFHGFMALWCLIFPWKSTAGTPHPEGSYDFSTNSDSAGFGRFARLPPSVKPGNPHNPTFSYMVLSVEYPPDHENIPKNGLLFSPMPTFFVNFQVDLSGEKRRFKGCSPATKMWIAWSLATNFSTLHLDFSHQHVGFTLDDRSDRGNALV